MLRRRGLQELSGTAFCAWTAPVSLSVCVGAHPSVSPLKQFKGRAGYRPPLHKMDWKHSNRASRKIMIKKKIAQRERTQVALREQAERKKEKEEQEAQNPPPQPTLEQWVLSGKHAFDYPHYPEGLSPVEDFTDEDGTVLPRRYFDILATKLTASEKHPIMDECGNIQHPPRTLTPLQRKLWIRAVRAIREEEMEFIEDELWKEYRDDHGPRPQISRRTKKQIVELHLADPENWNLDSLSVKFGLSKARIKAFLMFGKMERVAEAHGELLPDLIEPLLEEEFGVVDRFDDKIELAEGTLMNSISGVAEEENVKGEAVKAYLKKFLPKRPPKEEVPEEPPTPFIEKGESKIMFDTPIDQSKKFRGLIIIDGDDEKAVLNQRKQKKDDKDRLIWIHEPTGIIRTPTWMERYWLMKPKYHKPRGNSRWVRNNIGAEYEGKKISRNWLKYF